MRNRFASALSALRDDVELWKFTKAELGVQFPYPQSEWTVFTNVVELRDILDLVTLVFQRYAHADKYAAIKRHEIWLQTMRRIFSEENVGYIVDREGGVHFAIDAEFARNRAAAIAALQGGRYENVLNAVDRGMAAFDEIPPNGKAALRGVFSAAEGLFRLAFPSANLLGATEIDKGSGQ